MTPIERDALPRKLLDPLIERLEKYRGTEPEPRPLDDPRLQEAFGDAIEGALMLGYQNSSQPPEGHWLWRFWNIGRAEATRSRAPAQTPDRHLSITTNEAGECVAVSWQDDEHRILEVVWERAAAPRAPAPQPATGAPVVPNTFRLPGEDDDTWIDRITGGNVMPPGAFSTLQQFIARWTDCAYDGSGEVIDLSDLTLALDTLKRSLAASPSAEAATVEQPADWQRRTFYEEDDRWGAWHQCCQPDAVILTREQNLGIRREYRPLFTCPQPATGAADDDILQKALDRMDRARNILTGGTPRPKCNWGLLDTEDLRACVLQRATGAADARQVLGYRYRTPVESDDPAWRGTLSGWKVSDTLPADAVDVTPLEAARKELAGSPAPVAAAEPVAWPEASIWAEAWIIETMRAVAGKLS